MSSLPALDALAPHGKRVLLRADLNVPLQDGEVTDTTRIDRLKPTVDRLAEAGARVILLSHFGRPKGQPDPALSLKAVLPALESRLGRRVRFAESCIGAAAEETVAALGDGEVALLENLRFHPGEEANDPEFAAALARLGDFYVNDAFSAAHRAHASTHGLARRLPAAAGPGLMAEVAALTRALERPERPVMAVVGGAKISTKLDLLENLVAKVDILALGGGMANTFLAARGMNIGASLAERDMTDAALAVQGRATETGCELMLPVDGVVAENLTHEAESSLVEDFSHIPPDAMILDIGPASVAQIKARMDSARTLLWNGPLGAFEYTPFDCGTMEIARHAAARTAAGRLTSIAGGGDTLAALARAKATADFSFVSTAGGAFLEWCEGKELPGITALREAAPS